MDENIRPKTPEESAAVSTESDRSAANIMADPAAAAGAAKPAFVLAPPGSPEIVQQVLNALPGLIGGVDEALRHETGQKQGIPFALVIWPCDDMALHAANFNPHATRDALINFAENLKQQRPLAEGSTQAGIGDAANEKPC